MPVGEWNDFKSYVYRTGLGLVKKDEAKLKASERRKPTHLLLDGGRMHVPPERAQEFLETYARELSKGTDLFVVEMKSDPCFFFMSEFDIKLPPGRSMTLSEVERFVKAVQGVMCRAYPLLLDEDVHAVDVAVSTAPPKDALDCQGRPCVQSGVHLNWRIVVDLETAWILRAWIVRELDAVLKITDAEGDWPMRDSWVEAYDPCVLKDNGLRMIGSRKAEICPECKGRSFNRGAKSSSTGPSELSAHAADPSAWEGACATCQNVGRIDKGRPYALAMVCDARGEPMPDAFDHFVAPENAVDLVKYVSIRTTCAAPYEISFDSDEQETYIRGAAKADRKKKIVTAPGAAAEADDGEKVKKPQAHDGGDLVDLTPDDEAHQLVAKYVFTQFRGAPLVSRVKRSPGGDCYIANTRSHFCENKGGDHAHSFVYFVLKPSGCAQRCFCDKTFSSPGQTSTKRCRDFVGKMRPIPSDLAALLFPNALMAATRRDEKFLKIASRVLDTGRDYTMEDGPACTAASAAATVSPAPGLYGNPTPGISLPHLDASIVRGLRRRGITAKRDYNSIRAVAVPPYPLSRFLEDLRNANFGPKSK